jgi:uncharacterized protein YjbI with pentapeptide repeats
MRIGGETRRLEVNDADLGGSVFDDVVMRDARVTNSNVVALEVRNSNASRVLFDDVNLTGARFHNTKLQDVIIEESCIAGMRINGILVTELLELYDAAQVAGGKNG